MRRAWSTPRSIRWRSRRPSWSARRSCWADMVRFSLTGTEAVQAALRLARAVTGRRRFVRFEGQYHGWLDNVLIGRAGEAARPAPGSCPRRSTTDRPALERPEAASPRSRRHGDDVAAVIIEPMMLNQGAIDPGPGTSRGWSDCCDRHGALLIFDEVITGFRLPSGRRERFGVTPDLAIYGKAMAGSFPVSAIAGKASSWSASARRGQSLGTFNACVMAAAAVVATIRTLRAERPYERIVAVAKDLLAGLREFGARTVPLHVQGPAPSTLRSARRTLADLRLLEAGPRATGRSRTDSRTMASGSQGGASGTFRPPMASASSTKRLSVPPVPWRTREPRRHRRPLARDEHLLDPPHRALGLRGVRAPRRARDRRAPHRDSDGHRRDAGPGGVRGRPPRHGRRLAGRPGRGGRARRPPRRPRARAPRRRPARRHPARPSRRDGRRGGPPTSRRRPCGSSGASPGTVPIAVVLDLHGNPSPDLVERCDVVIAYDTYPHVDMYERGLEASALMAELLGGETTPHADPQGATPLDPARSSDRRASDERPARPRPPADVAS